MKGDKLSIATSAAMIASIDPWVYPPMPSLSFRPSKLKEKTDKDYIALKRAKAKREKREARREADRMASLKRKDQR